MYDGLMKNSNLFNNCFGKSIGKLFQWSYFDNSKVMMFDNWKVSILRKKIVSIQPNT